VGRVSHGRYNSTLTTYANVCFAVREKEGKDRSTRERPKQKPLDQ